MQTLHDRYFLNEKSHYNFYPHLTTIYTLPMKRKMEETKKIPVTVLTGFLGSG